MDTDTLNNVIDKLAEKLGVAVEGLQPIGEQILVEYTRMNLIHGAVALMICVLFGFVCYKANQGIKEAKPSDDVEIQVGCGVVTAVLSLISFIIGMDYVAMALSPTYNCLKTLLK